MRARCAEREKEIEQNLGPDELLEVYNELFPDDPYSHQDVHNDSGPLIKQLADHINGDLATDEIVDLWGLIFPVHRNVWYDEEENRIHYNEQTEPQAAD